MALTKDLGEAGQRQFLRWSVIAALVMLLSSVVAMAAAGAQETGGGISGTITDAQQGSLPGVLVTLRNEGTNATMTATTNEEGSFNFPFVAIGRYTLTAALQGFSTAKQENIEVRVADRLRIDLGLQVGALTEEVTVAAGAPLLETSTASRGFVIERAQVEDLPLLGRNPFSLAVLSPGVQYTPALASRSNRPFDNGGMDNFAINGGRAFTNEFLLDGVPNSGTETTNPNNLSFVPSPDATAEFRVQTSIYDAQYGRTGGGVVNVVLKSGTNQFHGAVQQYFRDESLNANTFDANRGGVAKAGLYWRQPGASFNGPVKIPGLYDGKDKTFFMYNWEQIRSEVPFPQVYTVPTALERQGDFSQTRTADGRPVTIYDPLTTRLVNGTYVRDAFPGNRIPANRMDPVGAAILAKVPLPNTGSLVNNLLVPDNARADKYDQHVLKVDQVLGQSQRFFARFARNKRTEINDYAAFPAEASPWYQHGRTNLGLAAEHTAVLSPSLVLSSRVGLHPPRVLRAGARRRLQPGGARLPGQLRHTVGRQTFPQIQWDGFTTFGSTFGGNNGSVFTTSDVWSWSEVLSKTMGNHAVQVRRRVPRDHQRSAEPDFVLRAVHVQSRVHAGRSDARRRHRRQLGGVAAARLSGRQLDDGQSEPGADQSADQLSQQLHRRVRAGRLARVAEADDQRRPALGLRVAEHREEQSAEHRLRRQRDQPVPGARPVAARRPAVRERRQPLPFKRDLNNFQPRLGMTYQLNDKTVMRGGYALAYLPTFDHGYNNGFSLNTTLVASTDGGITPSAR